MLFVPICTATAAPWATPFAYNWIVAFTEFLRPWASLLSSQSLLTVIVVVIGTCLLVIVVVNHVI